MLHPDMDYLTNTRPNHLSSTANISNITSSKILAVELRCFWRGVNPLLQSFYNIFLRKYLFGRYLPAGSLLIRLFDTCNFSRHLSFPIPLGILVRALLLTSKLCRFINSNIQSGMSLILLHGAYLLKKIMQN